MSDIVERLRSILASDDQVDSTLEEAAAELERLRAQVAETVPGAAREAEIGRLRAINAELLDALKHLIEGGYFEHEECDVCNSLTALVAKAEAKP